VKLAFVVSHPIQYYAPLYRRLAARSDVRVKVFFTWHAATAPVFDPGFGRSVAWDIPLTQGYDHVLVPNVARRPGTHHFNGVVNPTLVEDVLSWRPDAVHVTGWALRSHLRFMRAAHGRVPLLFRGDSHLLDGRGNAARWWAKRAFLRRVYSWPRMFLYTGAANLAYYEAFAVPSARLRACPHSVDVGRFADPQAALEQQAAQWRESIGVPPGAKVVLFAGKLEPRKRPLEMMRAVLERTDHFLVMAGNGELEGRVRELAAHHPLRCHVLPFQNQSAMPVVYRLGDVFVLPSSHGETWGLAVNEALACSRPIVVSDRVGCAA